MARKRKVTPSAQGRFTKTGFSPRTNPNPAPARSRKKTAAGTEAAETYDETLDKSCAYTTTAGRNIDQPYNTGEYRICLSKTQRDTLFGKRRPRYLGAGAAAIAYTRDAKRVVKITRDPDDVAALVAAKGIKHVVKTYQIYELVDAAVDLQEPDEEPLRTWAIVAEKLEPLGSDLEDLVTQLPVDQLVRHYSAVRGGRRAVSDYAIGADARRRMVSYACPGTDPACKRFVTQYIDTFQALGRRGVVFQDAHGGNFAQTKGGRWKIIDLGLSDTQRNPPPLPKLEGVFTGRISPRYHLRMPKVRKLK